MRDKKDGKTRNVSSRTGRLAAELRENLRRRKAQERGRVDPQTAGRPAVKPDPHRGDA
jgi:hypothetical protein